MGAMPISIELAQAVLSTSCTTEEAPGDPERIALAVADYYGVQMDALRGQKRDKAIVMPRQVAMFLMRAETDVSLLRIGVSSAARPLDRAACVRQDTRRAPSTTSSGARLPRSAS